MSSNAGRPNLLGIEIGPPFECGSVVGGVLGERELTPEELTLIVMSLSPGPSLSSSRSKSMLGLPTLVLSKLVLPTLAMSSS